MSRPIVALACAIGLLALPACQGARFTEIEWRPNLQSRTHSVTLAAQSASLDPWSERYVLEFKDDSGSPASASRSLVLEVDHTLPDADGQDAARVLKAWRYDSPGRVSLTPDNSRLKAGKIGFHRLPEDHVKGTFDLLFVSNVEGQPLYGDLTEFQLEGSFRVTLSPPRSR
ncbi:MAG: hypothetical protein HYR85_00085 [Planctomycetes bacterium]|nr:hypothetical protein [Planctomycetota bacterium]MBI3845929.1 hypothetical protein [Planctomycetota bacterium]